MTEFLGRAAAVAMVLLAWSADGATHHKLKSPPLKTSTLASSSKRGKKTSPKRTATSPKYKAATNKRNGHTAKRSAPATTWRNRQLSPSADRYREIQQALASKGYLQAEDATGTWNAASVDALKKFQSEQNLEAHGKINSLSLLALGLGTKREPAAPVTPAKPPQEPDHYPR